MAWRGMACRCRCRDVTWQAGGRISSAPSGQAKGVQGQNASTDCGYLGVCVICANARKQRQTISAAANNDCNYHN